MTARPVAGSGAVLYTPAILTLAVELARYPLTDTLPLRGKAQSRVCGSNIEVGLAARADGTVDAVGARVTACAIGQAAAALFLHGAAGRDRIGIGAALAMIEAWLSGDAPQPDWPGIEELGPARAYSARHAAILLPWKAALAALSNPPPAD